MNKLRVLDLFSGIGGFSLGLEATGGFETIGFSEIYPYACAVLKKHWPNVKNYGDIRTIPAVRADVVTASHPCQPFSVAGFGLGESDDRFLRPAMLKSLEASGAAWFVYENVTGIKSMELDCLLDDLENIGYTGQPFDIPACGVGAH
jgi:DNA (cytosine-5)-methyltransferase 1